MHPSGLILGISVGFTGTEDDSEGLLSIQKEDVQPQMLTQHRVCALSWISQGITQLAVPGSYAYQAAD